MGNRRVLITGIHRGLGHALASTCIEDGWSVYGLSREPPEDLTGPGLRFVPLDLRRFDEIPGAVRELLEGVESLDLAILNAGVLGEIKDLADTSLEEIHAVMDINVWANKILLDALVKSTRRVDQVVAISSGSAFNGSGGWGAYSISKSALNLLVRVYAHEHPETHMTAVAPGVVHTDMLDTVLAMDENPRYAANGRIRKALEESRVLMPGEAAAGILDRMQHIRQRPSGAYVDIRQL